MTSETGAAGPRTFRAALSRVTGFGLVLVLVVVFASCNSTSDETNPTTSTSGVARSQFDIRPVEAVLPPQAESPVGSVFPDRSGQIAYSVGPVALTNRDIKAARAFELTPGKWLVTLDLTSRAYRVIDRLAAEHWTKPPPQNGIVFVLDGVVQSEATFGAEHIGRDQGIEIGGDGYTEADAKAIAAALNR